MVVILERHSITVGYAPKAKREFGGHSDLRGGFWDWLQDMKSDQKAARSTTKKRQKSSTATRNRVSNSIPAEPVVYASAVLKRKSDCYELCSGIRSTSPRKKAKM